MQITIVPEGNVGGIQQLNSKVKTGKEFRQKQEAATVLKVGGAEQENSFDVHSQHFWFQLKSLAVLKKSLRQQTLIFQIKSTFCPDKFVLFENVNYGNGFCPDRETDVKDGVVYGKTEGVNVEQEVEKISKDEVSELVQTSPVEVCNDAHLLKGKHAEL